MSRGSENRGDGRRIPRVEREMREVIASYLISGFQSELGGFVSVSRVLVSKDLRHAKVFVTVMGENISHKAVVEELQSHAPEIQSEVNRRLRMKYCPRVTILYDEGFENVLKVERILRDLEIQRQESEANERPDDAPSVREDDEGES